MIRTAVYVPNYENLSLSKAVIDGSTMLDAYHTVDLNEVEGLLRDHDCHILVVFSPRLMAEVGQVLANLTPYLLRWHIPVSVIGTAPTLNQVRRMKAAAVTDYSVLPLGPNMVARRLTRAVMNNPTGQGWMSVPAWGMPLGRSLNDQRKRLFSENPFAMPDTTLQLA